MTWYAIFETGTTGASSNPISTGQSIDVKDLTASGRTSIILPGNPTGLVWSRTTQTFVAPVLVTPPVILTTLQFIQRFTSVEMAALLLNKTADVQFFAYQLSNTPTLSTTDAFVIVGLNVCVTASILTVARQAVIGA